MCIVIVTGTAFLGKVMHCKRHLVNEINGNFMQWRKTIYLPTSAQQVENVATNEKICNFD